ncbi:YidB family protein [Hafnia paralvei]
MGLLDSLGGMLGGQGQNADQIKVIMAWVEQQGGISALIEKFKSQGLGSIIESWIGTGNNQPISGEQVQNVFSIESITALASSLGINTENASQLLATYLPKLIDGLSPNGEIPQGNALVNAGLDILKGKFFS